MNKVSNTQTEKIVVKEVNAPQYSKRFFVKGDKKYHQIDYLNLFDIEAYGNYTQLFLYDEMILVIKKYLIMRRYILTNGNFSRVHRSFIVAIDKIKIIIDDHKIPITRFFTFCIGK